MEKVAATDIHVAQWYLHRKTERVFLEEKDAILLHYRPTCMQIFDKRKNFKFIEDRIMHRYAELSKRVFSQLSFY